MKVCSKCGHIYDGEGEICPHCSSSKIKCKRCGAENEPNEKFCTACGERFEQKKICVCGAKNSEDATICYACGRSLEEDEKADKKKLAPWQIAVILAAVFLILAIICLVI